MNYGIVVSGDLITEEILNELMNALKKVSGSEVQVAKQWLIWSDNAAVMAAVDTLLGELERPSLLGKRIGKNENPKAGRAPGVSSLREIQCWEVHLPGITGKTTAMPEMLTITEKNLRLIAGQFETGTLLRHPRAGWQRVMGPQGSGQGMEPMEAKEAIEILDKEPR